MVIVVTGSAAAGKSTFSTRLSRELSIPCISRDTIKELLGDIIPISSVEESQQVGHASFELLYYFLEQLLGQVKVVIVETTFKPEFDNKKFARLAGEYNVHFLQIYFHAEQEVIKQRFKERVLRGERHASHVDHKRVDDHFSSKTFGTDRPLELPGKMISIDTTDFNAVNWAMIIKEIQKEIKEEYE